MALPQPYDSEAGKRSMADEANVIWGNLTWIARLCKEIIAETTALNLKKAGQLIFHCVQFKTSADTFRDAATGDYSNILQALQQRIAERTGKTKTLAEINADLKALYDQCVSFSTWGLANFPQTSGRSLAAYLNIEAVTGRLVEEALSLTPVPQAVLTRVAALRATFE